MGSVLKVNFHQPFLVSCCRATLLPICNNCSYKIAYQYVEFTCSLTLVLLSIPFVITEQLCPVAVVGSTSVTKICSDTARVSDFVE
jgi:hypothetical protein